MTEVAEAIDLEETARRIIASRRDCSVCEGWGFKTNGKDCGGCNGEGEVNSYPPNVLAVARAFLECRTTKAPSHE